MIKDWVQAIHSNQDNQHQSEQVIAYLEAHQPPVQDVITLLKDIQTDRVNETLVAIVSSYAPSYRQTQDTDPDFMYLHKVDASLRHQDDRFFCELLQMLFKLVRSKSMHFESPLMSMVLNTCVMFSGLFDEVGFARFINRVTPDIGYIPLELIEYFDDETTFASVAFIRIIQLSSVFFGCKALGAYLNHLHPKGDHHYIDTEKIWLAHHATLQRFYTQSTASNYLFIRKQCVELGAISTYHELGYHSYIFELKDL